MRVRTIAGLLAGVVSLGVLATSIKAAEKTETGTLTVHVDQPGAKIGSLFYGLMTEEINHSYDGGLYAELIQNRIFQDNRDKATHWSVVKSDSADGAIAIDTNKPVNDAALKRSLRLDVKSVSGDQRVGIANDGYWGIPAWPNTKYKARFWARASDGFDGSLTVAIESNDGNKPLASAPIEKVTGEWKKYEVELTTGQLETSTANHFAITTNKPGTLWFSLVSLFPPTYNDRPNGTRIDIMQKLAGLNPKFLRFPGGNFVEGNTIAERFAWKTTIGPLEDRPGHPGCWGYRASDGLGLLEFLEWCEDLHMEPLLAVYAGYSLRGEHVVAGPKLEPFVQEALEEIEYCTGDETTTWGKRRAQDGHPKPFVIHYIEVGNEDFFDRSGSYSGRFDQFYEAIKAKYPQLLCISTTEVKGKHAPDLRDDHDYPSYAHMLAEVGRYDNYAADQPRVFFGEWATRVGDPTPTLKAALADCAWLTGLQRNSDKVILQCYAPLFVNVNRGGMQWATDLIGYDAASSFGSASYWGQAIFSKAWGDTNLTTEVATPQLKAEEPKPHGYVGVGTWKTAAEYKDIKVTHGDQTLYMADLTKPLDKSWHLQGRWATKDGVLAQTNAGPEDQRATVGEVDWADYTLSLKARKTSGQEGFLVMVHTTDRDNFRWINIGGWGNAETGIERCTDGTKEDMGPRTPFKVDTDTWYDIRVEVAGKSIKLFVDDKPVLETSETPMTSKTSMYAAASTEESTGDIILKVVNIAPNSQPMTIDLGSTNVKAEATVEYISGNMDDQNSLDHPTKVAPKTEAIKDASSKFTHEFPAQSVSVIRLKTK